MGRWMSLSRTASSTSPRTSRGYSPRSLGCLPREAEYIYRIWLLRVCRDGSMDVIISNCVLNLSPDKPRVFAEIARVLAPGGRIHISDLVAESLPDWVRADADLYSSCIAGAISEEEYVQGLRAAGLGDAQVADRFVYDITQLEELLGSELSQGDAEQYRELLSRTSQELDGKVASIMVTGHRS